jgi:uncharacterized membrane protein HdeD (DUF308 family)
MTEMYVREELAATDVRRVDPGQFWWLLLLAGLISLGVGVVVVANPDRSLKVLCALVGIYLLAAGVILIVKTASEQERGAGGILAGILALIAGVVVIRHPGQSLVAVALAVGIWFIVGGAIDLSHAITGPHRLLYLLRGGLFVAAGTIIVASPHITLKTLAILIGIGFIVNGALQIAEAFVVRSRQHAKPG